ncbi:MAG TPA: potassium channel family protein [Streptosporangiaceae bacterium]|nr:potassium channel family protein [Streptosporangiaceae bacterium]
MSSSCRRRCTATLPDARHRRRAVRGSSPSQPTGRYGLLLLLLIVTYLLSASGLSAVAAYVQFALFFGVVVLVLRTSQLSGRVVMLTGVVTLVGSAGAIGAAVTRTGAGIGAADLWKGVLLLFTAVLIVQRVLSRPTVTVQSIYGALSAYLIIGLMYAAFYGAIQHLGGGDFFTHGQPANTQTFQYFSFTTLTTLGYGDFTAAGNPGRALAVIEALTGQIFLATLVARLVAVFRAAGNQDRPQARRRWPPPGTSQRSPVSRPGRTARPERPERRR